MSTEFRVYSKEPSKSSWSYDSQHKSKRVAERMAALIRKEGLHAMVREVRADERAPTKLQVVYHENAGYEVIVNDKMIGWFATKDDFEAEL